MSTKQRQKVVLAPHRKLADCLMNSCDDLLLTSCQDLLDTLSPEGIIHAITFVAQQVKPTSIEKTLLAYSIDQEKFCVIEVHTLPGCEAPVSVFATTREVVLMALTQSDLTVAEEKLRLYCADVEVQCRELYAQWGKAVRGVIDPAPGVPNEILARELLAIWYTEETPEWTYGSQSLRDEVLSPIDAQRWELMRRGYLTGLYSSPG